MTAEVAIELMELAGGDPFVAVRRRSEVHQQEHGCGLHNAGGPQMHLVAALARAANARSVLDLGSGLGYSTLWLADAVGADGSVLGIDDDSLHTDKASKIAHELGYDGRVSYRTGPVVDILPTVEGPVDMIHDDAWFAKTPEHLDMMLSLLRPGGLLTMANWFLLVDALTGAPRNDWASFAGPTWAEDTKEYAQLMADRSDLSVVWITRPPIGFATKTGTTIADGRSVR